jgi:hypothetical protein
MASKEIDSSCKAFFSISPVDPPEVITASDFPSSLDIALETLIPPPASNKGV